MNEEYTEFINFFKRHNLYNRETFDYLCKNSIHFDYLDKDKHPYIGYHYLTNEEGNLSKIILFVPYIDSKQTILINIHEYIHGIILYNKLGKRYKLGKDAEILSFLFEKIYLLEKQDKNLELFQKNLNKLISESSPIEYKIALEAQEEMLQYYYDYNPSFVKLEEKAKKLAKRYKSK